jgi:ATPase subunit of ABC transporter with duplicated ATPase domains
MAENETVIRFNDVTFEFGPKKPILHEASFSMRRGSKITLMGQNGAGKTTLFKLITGDIKPDSGSIAIAPRTTIATAKQVIPREQLTWTLKQFFESVLPKKTYNIDPKIDAVLEIVNLSAPHNKLIKEFSGGQQARLLLAQALIQNPDILLLDEPTNNLDKAGIAHLKQFLISYSKTCLVISHDAEFLNSFTDGVWYLESFVHSVEQYNGNYFTVVADIQARRERERAKNAQLQKEISQRKEKANFFGQKGGHMRDVARKMREKINELEDETIEMRRDDKTIRPFTIPCQENIGGVILSLSSVSIMHPREQVVISVPVSVELRKKERLVLKGPNGIGKTTLLNTLATGHAHGELVEKKIRISYYRQDFSTLDINKTVYEELKDAMQKESEEELRSYAAGFLITHDVLQTKIGALSEGQKGLVSFAVIATQRPGLLILDEPTNHINFRHLPIIAQAINSYEGALVDKI